MAFNPEIRYDGLAKSDSTPEHRVANMFAELRDHKVNKEEDNDDINDQKYNEDDVEDVGEASPLLSSGSQSKNSSRSGSLDGGEQLAGSQNSSRKHSAKKANHDEMEIRHSGSLPFIGRNGSVFWKTSPDLGTDFHPGQDRNGNKQLSWKQTLSRLVGGTKIVYIRSTLIPTKMTSTTGAVRTETLQRDQSQKCAVWNAQNNNLKEFFIPTKYVDETQLPIKMLVEIWEMNANGMDIFIGSNIIELRPLSAVPDVPRTLQFKVNYGPSNQVGTLDVRVCYTETLTEKTHQRLQSKLISNDDHQNNVNHHPQDQNVNLLFGMIQIEFLEFEINEPTTIFKQYELAILSIAVFVIFTLTFAGILHATEPWSFLTSMYFTMTTLTGVGYGDIQPESKGGKAVTAILVILTNILVLVWIIHSAHKVMVQHHDQNRKAHDSMKRLRILKMHCEEKINHNTTNMTTNQKKDRYQSNPHRKMGDFQGFISSNQKAPSLEVARLFTDFEITKIMRIQDAMRIAWSAFALFLWLMVWSGYFTVITWTKMEFGEALYFGIDSSTRLGMGNEDYPTEEAMTWICMMLVIGVALWMYLAVMICVFINEYTANALNQDIDLEKRMHTTRDMQFFEDGDKGSSMTQREFLQNVLINMKLVPEMENVIEMINLQFVMMGDGKKGYGIDEIMESIE